MKTEQSEGQTCYACGEPSSRCTCWYDDDDYEDSRSCYECGGRGWKIVCPDDLCHGQDECIHGDPPIPCPVCNPKGDRFEGYFG